MLASNHRRQGQQLIEVAAAFIVLIPLFLFLIDMYMVFLFANINEGAARDAARAASAVRPPLRFSSPGEYPYSQEDELFKRARSVVDLMDTRTKGYVKKIELLTSATNTILHLEAPIPTELYGGPYRGWVRVRTQITFDLPVCFGNFGKGLTAVGEGQFPLTYHLQGNVQQFVDPVTP